MSSVNLIGITQPDYEYTGCIDAQELVAWCARISNPSNQNNTQTAPKLLRYLIKNHHWSPLELVHISLEVKTTRDIARQILRHRSFSFSEYSQRYADPTKDLKFVTREARLQDPKNRQNSVDVDDDTTYDKPYSSTSYDTLGNVVDHSVQYQKANLKDDWEAYQKSAQAASLNAYKWAIDNGIAKEQARAVLPEGLTESVLIMSGSLRSFWHYILVRHHPATQKEHRIVAEQITEVILERFPDMREMLEKQIAENYK